MTFSRVFFLCVSDSADNDNVGLREKVESLFFMARWVLDQSETSAPLGSDETRAKCVANILVGEVSFKLCSCEFPHESFRVLGVLVSCDLDLRENIQGEVEHMLEWDGRRSDTPRRLPTEEMGDDHKDASSNLVCSVSHLIRWLALEVGAKFATFELR